MKEIFFQAAGLLLTVPNLVSFRPNDSYPKSHSSTTTLPLLAYIKSVQRLFWAVFSNDKKTVLDE